MIRYLHLVLSITVPILILCGCGILLKSFRKNVDSKLLADISLFILAPALIFSALSESHLRGSNVLHIILFTIIMTAVSSLIARTASKLAHLPENSARALTLTTLFSNSNNYGLPVLLLAYGSRGFSLGAVYVIGQIILVNVLGMYLASRNQLSGRQAFQHILKSPLIYACIAGLIFSFTRLPIPGGADKAILMLGSAYPTLVLIILGIKLAGTSFKGLRRKEVWLGIGLRLIAVPLAALAVLQLLKIHGLLAAVLFVETSMPAAINTVTLSEKFDGDTDTIALIVSVTTLLSFFYIPALVAIF